MVTSHLFQCPVWQSDVTPLALTTSAAMISPKYAYSQKVLMSLVQRHKLNRYSFGIHQTPAQIARF